MLLDLDQIFDNDRPRVRRALELTPSDLPSAWRELYEERAAIREYSGGMPRELAEHYALQDILEMMRTESR
ncbi:MAG: hypothetical protein L0241_14420 [Planctomycetia bacterium]|nr:hypothetical protein [Planctomycetia bacterium]